MNFGDLLSDDPTNASASGGGNPSHPRAGRVSSGPPPGGGGGPGKNLASFGKGVGGNRRGSSNTSENHRRGGTTPESLGDESDPNHNVFGHVGGIGSLSHDLSFLEDMEDSMPIPPGELSLKSNSATTTTTSDICSTTGGSGGLPAVQDFENAESVYLDELADLLDERSIAISAPSLMSCGGQVDQAPSIASKTSTSPSLTSTTFTNIPLSSVVSSYGSKTSTSTTNFQQSTSTSSSILNTTLARTTLSQPSSLSGNLTALSTGTQLTTGLPPSVSQTPFSNYTSSPQLLQLQQTSSSGPKGTASMDQRLIAGSNKSPNLQSIKPVSITASSNSVSPNIAIGNSRVTNGGGTIVSASSTSPIGSDTLQRSIKQQPSTNEQRQQQVNRQKQTVRRSNATTSLPPGASPTNVSPQQISSSGTSGSPTTSGHGGSPAGAALAAVSAMLRSLNVPKECLAPLAADSLAGFVFTVGGIEGGDGKVDFISESVRDHVGKSAQQIRGQSIFNFLHRDDHSSLQSVFSNRNLPLGQRRTFSCRFLTASGSPAPTSATTSSNAGYESLQVTYVVVPKPQQPLIRGAAKPTQTGPTTRLVCVARKLNVSAGAGPPGTPATPAVTSSLLQPGLNIGGANNMLPHPQSLLTVATPPQSNNEINIPGSSSPQSNKMELFTTKVDPTSFKILQADIVPHSQSSSSSSTSTASSSPMSNGLLRASMAARTGTMTGKDLLEFCHPDDHDILREHFKRTLGQNGAGGDTSKVYRMRNLIGNTSSSKGLNGGQNVGLSQQRLVHVQTFSMYYKSDVAGGMPTNHHHGHAHANNKDKGYVISTHSVISTSPPQSKSPTSQDALAQGGRQTIYGGPNNDSRITEGGTSPALNQYLSPNFRTSLVGASNNSSTVSSSTTQGLVGNVSAMNLPKTSHSLGSATSTPSRLSTLLQSTSSRSSASSTYPSHTLPINSPSSGNNSSQQNRVSSEESSATSINKSEGSPSNEATQKHLLLKQLLNPRIPPSTSGSSALAAAAAAQAAAAAAASTASIKGDALSPGTSKTEKSPSPPTENSRILQLLSQNSETPNQQKLSLRLSDQSHGYGLPNVGRQPQNNPSSTRSLLQALPSSTVSISSGPYSSTISTMPSDVQGSVSSIETVGGRQSLKRAASDPLGGVIGAKQQSTQQQTPLSAVCSENPSLASLLSKPPAQASRTVPPPVPTKWHQEPKEKLPSYLIKKHEKQPESMRKFLPPHPAERTSTSRSKGGNPSPGGSEPTLLQKLTSSSSQMSENQTKKSILTSGTSDGIGKGNNFFSASPSNANSFINPSSNSDGSNNIPTSIAAKAPSRRLSTSKLTLDTLSNPQTSNSQALTGVMNTQSSVSSEPSDDDPMLDAILNDVIEIQEKSPPLTIGANRVQIGHKRSTRLPGTRNQSSISPEAIASPASAAILAEHSQISDIEKYLASAENTPPRENSPLQNVSLISGSSNPALSNQQVHNNSQITAVKSQPPPPPSSSSSAALSSPSLTSILSAPPIAAISVPMRNIIGGSRPLLPTTTAISGVSQTTSKGIVSTTIGAAVSNSQQLSSSSDQTTLLAPRINDLMSVPPNVSLSDCPDLNSLIHLQNAEQENQRRRRMSSGGVPNATGLNGSNSGIAPSGSNVNPGRQSWPGNRTTTNFLQLPQSSPQGVPVMQGSGASANRIPLSVNSNSVVLQSPPGAIAVTPSTIGNRIQPGPSSAGSISASSNSSVHPPPTNILAQHLQRGMTKNTNSATTSIHSIPATVGSQGQANQGIPSQTFPTSSSHTFITVGSKPNLTSPPTVSTTTLSLINSTGFVASNASGQQSTYSMPSNQQIIPSNQINNGQIQNQQGLSNTLQNQQMSFNATGNQPQISVPVDPSQASRRASYSGGNNVGSIMVGSSNSVGGAAQTVANAPMSPSPQLQGLLMQQPNNPATQIRGKESQQQLPNGMQHIRRRASGSATNIVSPLQPSPSSIPRMMGGMNSISVTFQGSGNTLNAAPSAVVNNGGVVHATRTSASNVRNRQLSGPVQNSVNPMPAQLQNPVTSQGVLANRIPGPNLQPSGGISNPNPLGMGRSSQNVRQMQPLNQIQIPGSNYVQVPSNQLPPQQPSISQPSLAQQPRQASPQQQQQPHNSNGVGGQSLLQQLLSE